MSSGPGRVMMDATELLQNPILTGIQRVVRSMIKYWPDPGELALCRFDEQRQCLVEVRMEAAEVLLEAGHETSLAERTRRVAAAMGPATPVGMDDKMLVPEVFFDFPRCAHHRWRLQSRRHDTFFFVHDFIPWLQPWAMGTRETGPLMHYLQLVRDADLVGFNSTHTRDEYKQRIWRNRPTTVDMPVFPLGADGPAVPRQSWSPGRNTYLCVGSIDGRKNQGLVMDAFELLWARGGTARLTLVGRLFENKAVGRLDERIAALAAREPRFRHVWDIDDAALAGLYGTARATIYGSEIEGFGLPPAESLHCGVPVVASARVPSIGDMGPAGQVRLAEVTAEAIADAVTQLEDDDAAARLWAAASGARTYRWAEMVGKVSDWVHGR